MQKRLNLIKNLAKQKLPLSKITQQAPLKLQTILTGMLFVGSQYGFQYMKQGQSFQNQEPSTANQFETDSQSQIVFEQFTPSVYEQALKNKEDIIVIIEPDRFKEQFLEEIQDFLQKFKSFQNLVKGRKIRFLKSSFNSKKEMEQFQKDYDVKIERDTIFLLHNQYMKSFYAFGSYEWFENKEYFFKYFRKITKLNEKNHDLFKNNLYELTSENVILLGYSDKNSKEYKEQSRKFGVMTLLKEYSDNPLIHCMFVNDPQVAKELGLEKSGDLYILQKTSKYNYGQSNVSINGEKFLISRGSSLSENLYGIIDSNCQAFSQNNIFTARSFEKDYSKYTIVLETNDNKITKQEKRRLVSVMGEFHKKINENSKKQPEEDVYKEIQFVNLKRNNKQKKFYIYIRDDINSMKRAQAHQFTSKEEIDKLNIEEGNHSYIYGYPAESPLEAESLLKWFENVRNKKAPEDFKSSEEPFYRKYSKKLTADSFTREVLENNQDQAVFFYSKNCYACRMYGSIYEGIGLEKAKKNENVTFNRMNTDFNTLSKGENFPYTPVFQVYKNGNKEYPYVYRSEKFTPELLEDFITVTSQFKLIPEQTFQNIFDKFETMEFTQQKEQN